MSVQPSDPAASSGKTRLLTDNELLARIDERLPRYTSYPTALHFTPDIGASTHAAWLGALDPQQSVSLYLHVPFCEQLCHYCGCHTTVANNSERIAQYAQLLMREIHLVSDAIGRRQPVSHIHWGGGTPSALAAGDFLAVAQELSRRFEIVAEAEIAVEIDPRHLSPAHIGAFAEAGVNRASLGVQDLNPIVQQAIGRIQSLDQTARAVDALRTIGVSGISFDLMYGLPHQTPRSVIESVSAALTLKPSRVSLFGYAHVPWMKKHQALISVEALPDSVARLAQLRAAQAVLASNGYLNIGLDHFAQANDTLALAQAVGRLRRNFQGYTDDDASALIGFGASAIGSLPQGYVQNASHLKQYREAIERGDLAVARGFALSDEDRCRRTIIERLMCDLTIDLASVTADPTNDFAFELDRLSSLADDGFVTTEETRIVVPERMRPFVRQVASVFDRHLQQSTARHSTSV